MVSLAPIRVALYVALILFSLVLFGLTAARLHYTLTLPPFDPLNRGHKFYDPIIAELLFASLLSLFWSFFAIHAIHKRRDRGFATTFFAEIVGLAIVWLFWLVGAAIATSIWPDLSFCHTYRACRILTALVAFAWVGWITITVLLVLSILFSIANKDAHGRGAWGEPMHGEWDPNRGSIYGANTSANVESGNGRFPGGFWRK